MYIFDCVYLVRQLLPPLWRGGAREALMQSLCAPVQQLYKSFMRYRVQADERINLRPQVATLVHGMHRLLAPHHSPVYITDGDTNGHYIVHVSIRISHRDAQAIQGFLSQYRRIGTRYTIQYYV